MIDWNVIGAMLGAAALSGLCLGGCGGDGGNGGGGSGGATTTTTTTTSASTGGGGAAGGSCLPTSEHASLFTIADTAYCAVAKYQAEGALGFQLPSWGRHQGPLTVAQDTTGGGVTLTRWALPAGATGALQKQETHVDIGLPATAFISQQATDVPFFGWTALGWAGAYPDTAGKMLMLADATIARSYDVNGAYATAAVGDTTSGRLLFSALSPLGSVAAGANALYAADACATPTPDLGAGDGCQSSLEIAAWGEFSGPVAVDRDGNVFSVLPYFADTQEARGFAASEIARGAAATPGTKLFELPGFGSSLAAIAPKGAARGKLIFQPFDSMATPGDVIAQSYVVEGGKVSPEGTPQKLLAMPTAAPVSLYLMTDDQDRLWVAASDDEAKTTTYVVLAPKP